MDRFRLALFVVAGCAFLAASSAEAVPLSLGNNALPGTTLAARPELAGVDVTPGGDLVTPISFNEVIGTVVSSVIRENVTGTLDFYWQVSVSPAGLGAAIAQFRVFNFGFSYLTDADWRIDSAGTDAPDTAVLYSPITSPSGLINFEFNNTPVPRGDTSYSFFLHTNATKFAETGVFNLCDAFVCLRDGISSPNMPTFAPVPEPPSLVLLVVGLGLMGARTRRARVH